jgi:hypothetical protein
MESVAILLVLLVVVFVGFLGRFLKFFVLQCFLGPFLLEL